MSEYHKKYYVRNREKLLLKAHKYYHESGKVIAAIRHQQGAHYRRQVKLETFNAYGGKCQCCGEDELSFLVLDHVNGGGETDRKKFGSGVRFYIYLRKNGFPQGKLQVLCANCNTGKALLGVCPHQINKGE